jgi:L-2,4-diaminobutyrate decarboxylase
MPRSQGVGTDAALKEYGEFFTTHAASPSHPLCMAHLHCPPSLAGVASEVLIAAMNQSLDSWDQSPSATVLEVEAIKWLLSIIAWSEGDGIFTTGGTASNQMAVLVAIENAMQHRWNTSYLEQGATDETKRFRIITSEHSHFSIEKAASLAGLGRNSVVRIKADPHDGINIEDLKDCLDVLAKENLIPLMIVGTCGTTDFGSIDPLAELAMIAKRSGAWLHVDAAYGGALLFVSALRNRIDGIGQADSIGLDFHKMFLQPISCAAFLVRHAQVFEPLRQEHDYLDRDTDREQGMINLVGKSLQTTRRADVLKILVSMRAWGLDAFADFIQDLNKQARLLAQRLSETPGFEVVDIDPSLSTLLFRYVPHDATPSDSAALDRLQENVRYHLFQTGMAVIGQTKFQGRIYLKATLLNPLMNESESEKIISSFVAAYAAVWKGP